MPDGQKNNIIFICGQKGSGKTYLAANMARSLHSIGRRVICVAPMAGFALPGSPIIKTAEIGLYHKYKNASIVVNPTDDNIALTAFRYALTVGDLCLFVDEIDLYFSPFKPDDNLLRIVRYGRHFNLSLVAISQRPASVCKDLIAQADYKIFFRTTEPNDLAYLKKWSGIDPGRLQSLADRKKIVLTTKN